MWPIKSSLMCQIWTVELLRNFKRRKLVTAHIDSSTVFLLIPRGDVRCGKGTFALQCHFPPQCNGLALEFGSRNYLPFVIRSRIN